MRFNSGNKNIVDIIKIIIIGAILCIVGGIYIYFSKSLGSMVFILLIFNLIGFIVGIIIFISSKIKFKRFNGQEVGIIILVISILSCIPTCAAFVNKVITTANANNEVSIEIDKEQILFNLDKETFMKRLELYHFSVNGLDLNNFTNIKKDNIDFYYENENCFNSINTIEELIKVKGKEFENIFELEKVDNIKIGIADKMIFQRTIASYFNYNDTMMISSSITLENLKKEYEDKGQILENTFEESVLHEYIHLLLRRAADERKISYSDLPNWFIEGTAMYMYKSSVGVEMPGFTDKKGNIKNDNNFKGKKAEKYYNQSMYLIKYLFNKQGDRVLVDILDEMGKGQDIYKSIEKVVGDNFEDINSSY